jgi:anti-sigma factor RsiW
VTCAEVSIDLGAYVLGALDPVERQRVEQHVRDCPACAAELAGFVPLPGLLSRVREEDLQPVAVTPSPDLFLRMSAAAARSRSPWRSARTWTLVAAAVLVVLGVAAGVTAWVTRPTDQAVTATAGPVEVTVVATAVGDESALDVDVSGLWPGEMCSLVAVDRDGNRHDAGSWNVSEDGDGSWRGWADVDRSALTGVVVLGDGGRELVRVPL